MKLVRTNKEKKEKKANIILLVIVLVVIGASQIMAIEFTQSLQPQSIPFEATAKYEIKISWAGPQSRYYFPKPLRPEFERLTAGELSSSISSVGTGADEVTTKRYEYTLIPNLSGLGRIEPISIEYISWPDSIPGQLVTEPMTLTIANPKPVVRNESGTSSGFWLIMIGLVVLVSGGLYYLLIVKKKANQKTEHNPEQEFLTKLDNLHKESPDDLKRFQTGVYKLLVEYLGRRYQVSSETGNAQDYVELLKVTALQVEHQDQLSAWLIRAEKEKFSPAAVAPGATMRLFSEIKQFFETKLLQ